MARLDRLERLTDLVMVLLQTSRPLSLEEIAREVPGYPQSSGARRQAFERDKRLLREEGIPVLTEPVGGPEQFGYRIRPDSYYLPDLQLTPDEQQALRIAVAGVHLGETTGGDALWKLGALSVPDPTPFASLLAPDALHVLFDGIRRRATVSFSYHGRDREISPGVLWFRRGHWYLVGWDHAADARRTYRVDRIRGRPRTGPPKSAEVLHTFDPTTDLPEVPWQVGEGDETDVVIDVDPIEAPRVVQEVGASAVVDTRDEGSVRISLTVTNMAALRSWVLGLLDHAEVVAPAEARAAIVDWLRSMEQEQGRSTSRRRIGEERRRPRGAHPRSQRTAHAATTDARARFRRLLAMMGWLAQVQEAALDEVGQRFGIPRDEVVKELELAACCGVPPYTPDALMEIIVTEERVHARLAPELGRPRQLTPMEGLAVVTAARTLLAVPGSDPDGALSRAVGKLDGVLGAHRVLVDLDEPLHLHAVRDALEERRTLALTYHSASSDRTTQRRVDPLRLLAIDGHWYLDGIDGGVGALRRFRLDRIRDLAIGGPARSAVLAGTGQTDPGPAFVPGVDAVAVRLRLAPDAWWVLETIPLREVRELGGGGWEVELFVAGTAWLSRLLLQLGPNARVVAPERFLDAGPSAARRLLARYEGGGGAASVATTKTEARTAKTVGSGS